MIKRLMLTATACGLAALAQSSRADVYADATNDLFTTGAPFLDFSSAVVTNDTTTLYFTINLMGNPIANNWGDYGIALVTGPGGATNGNGSGAAISLTKGMNYWVHCKGNGSPQLWQYNTNTLTWSNIGGATFTNSTSSLSLTVPYASLGLTNGATFQFDVYSYSGGGAMDDLANPSQTITWWSNPYTNNLVETYPAPATVISFNSYTNSAPGNWSVNGSWTGAKPAAGGALSNIVVLQPLSGALAATNDLAGTFLLNQITGLANTSSLYGNAIAFVINGPTFPLLTNSSGSPLNFYIPMTLGARTTFGAGDNITVNGIINGSGGLTKSGNGVLTLSGANTYTAPTTVNGGTLRLVNGGSIFSTLNNNLGNGVLVNGGVVEFDNYNWAGSFGTMWYAPGNIVINGGTLRCVAGTSILGQRGFTVGTAGATLESAVSGVKFTLQAGGGGASIVSSGTGELTLTGGGDGEIGLAVPGAGGLTMSGAGTWTLTGANTFSGPTTISAGTLAVSGAGVLGGGAYAAVITNHGVLSFSSSSAQTLSGVISGSGGLTQTGPGVLTLAAANTYNGQTSVNAGELVGVTGGSCSNSALVVASGTTNGVQILTAGGTWACGNLTYGDGAYVNLNFGSNSPAAVAPLLVNGNLVLDGGLNIILRSSGGIASGVFPLIHYTGALSGTPPYDVFSQPTGWTGILSNDVIHKSLVLVVATGFSTSTAAWAVGNGVWDINTTVNWKDASGNPAKYADLDVVMFDDTASGASPIAVTLDTQVSPLSVTADVTNKNYTISGAGAIAGTGSLTKNGPGALTLEGANWYSGGTTLNEGSLIVSDPAALGAWGASLLLNGGTLDLRTDSSPYAYNTSVGTNSIIVCDSASAGAGIADTLGTLSIGACTLSVAPGSKNITADSPYGLTFADSTLTGNPVFDVANNGLGTGTLTLGAVSGGFSLTKQNTGTLALSTANTYTGNTTVSGGTLTLVSGGSIYDAAWNSTSVVTISNNAALEFDTWGYGPPNSFGDLDFGPGRLVINGGTLRCVAAPWGGRSLSVGTAGGTLESAGSSWTIAYDSGYPSVVFQGLATLTGTGNGRIDKNITGAGGLAITGTGAWTLTGTNNTYSGVTLIKSGKLALLGEGSVSNSPLINVTNGATFDISALVSTFDLGTNQTLTGGGTVNGDIINDGTVAPNGTLTFNNRLTFNPGSKAFFALNRTNAPASNDSVAVLGLLSATDATLTVSNAGPTLLAGDTFVLFGQAVSGFTNLNLPSGYTWTNHLAVDGSISVLSVTTIALNPTNISYAFSGATLTLSWPADYLGWYAQSNAVNLTVPSDWFDVPNSQNATNLVITVNPANPKVFYRLRRP